MSACVIFNPAARGEKAGRFREFLSTVATQAVLKPTYAPGSARDLARLAVEAGHTPILAAGGDGTVFEVLNGLGDAAGGLDRAALGVLPMGTANVLAHELGMPMSPTDAWAALQKASERRVDCGVAEFQDTTGRPARALFAVVAGAGLDARAVQITDLRLKRRLGKLAYVIAAWQALVRYRDQVRAELDGREWVGRALLVGNGRYYAGAIPVFEEGSLHSGNLQVRGVEQVTLGMLAACLRAYLTRRWTLGKRLCSEARTELRMDAARPGAAVPLELDGEFVGWLPARVSILPGALRVLMPGQAGH